MASEEQKNDESVKGFAGLSSMVSDVDNITASQETWNSEPPTEATSTTQINNQPTSEPESRPDSWRQAQPPPNDSSGIFWLIAICAVIFFIWLNSESGNNSEKPTPTSHSSSSAVDSSTQSMERSKQAAPTQPLIPIRPSEEKPPVGTSLNLDSAQIRYCLAEDIRLGGAKQNLNNYIGPDVDRFNVMVNDYNSRCGHFRYRNGALESAKSEVENYREVLESDGRGRFIRTPSIGSQQIPVGTDIQQPDYMVMDLQKRLNELGYDAGKVDGLAGGKTRTAIMAIQKVLGIPVNGIPNVALLKELESISQSSNAKVAIKPTPPLDETPDKVKTEVNVAAQRAEAEQAKLAIKQKVNRIWTRPVSATEGLKCTIRVKLMSDGTVIDAEVVSSSGDEIFDRSAENAVNKASPLPVPKDKDIFAREFRSFQFLFNPK